MAAINVEPVTGQVRDEADSGMVARCSVIESYKLRMKPRCADNEEIVPQAALFFHICLLNSVLERGANRATEKQGLTLAQWMALGCAGSAGAEGLTHSDLGQRLMLSKAPITGVVDRLEHRGYVQRVADARDRRVSRVVITPQGEEAWKRVRGELRAVAVERCGCLSEQELETMLDLTQRLLDSAAGADPMLANLNVPVHKANEVDGAGVSDLAANGVAAIR